MSLGLLGLLLGGLSSLVLAGVLYIGEAWAGWPFVPFDLFDMFARALPGDVVTFGIDTIVDLILVLNLGSSTAATAKLLEQLMALGLFVLIGAAAGWVVAWLIERRNRPGAQSGLLVGTLLFLLALALELSMQMPPRVAGLVWLALVFAAWGAGLGRLIEAAGAEERTAPERRSFLAKAGAGALVLTAGAWGLGRVLQVERVPTGAGEDLVDVPVEMADLAAEPAELEGRPEPAPGTRPEVTPEGEFYRIDINTRPVVIRETEWQLEVAGLFENTGTLTLGDLRQFPAVTQPITLSCISNRIGGSLIDTAYWTGVRLPLFLAEMGLQPEAQELFIEAADGFYESVSQADMQDPRTLLVYGMNGQTLPVEHGFPLRIYIPNRYGMKQPKWITRLEAIAGEGPGYWVERGWSPTARPHIVSVIDTVAVEEATEAGRIPVGGIAWAGDRGIAQVEVQVDDGPWQAANLREPPLSTLTWVLWRFEWAATPGDHVLRVRATDGEGMLQIEAETDVRPDGATGYHAVTQEIVA